MTFNPNNAGIPNGNYFALPFSADEAALVLASATWDATVSYRAGTADAPSAIVEASAQVDLYDIEYGNVWQRGIGTLPQNEEWRERNANARFNAQQVIAMLEKGTPETDSTVKTLTASVNEASQWLNDSVYTATKALLAHDKIIGLIGGDHSVPFGYLRALAERHADFGILHIDAHADLRQCYEGFEFSHASIMYNVLSHIPQVAKIVQVGIRDLCADEMAIAASSERVAMYDDYYISRNVHGAPADNNKTWAAICALIINDLPQNVYISFDIDGLSPDNCPATGTPVPGGLSFREACYLLSALRSAKKHIIGFDLCEVGNAEWDAIVGARILYKLCGCALK
jgi:agmatinase